MNRKGQFKPGQSGNPNGRPVGVTYLNPETREMRKNNLNRLILLVHQYMDSPYVNFDYITPRNALDKSVMSLVKASCQGNMDAFKFIVNLICSKLPDEDLEEFTDEEIRMMRLAKKIRDEDQSKPD